MTKKSKVFTFVTAIILLIYFGFGIFMYSNEKKQIQELLFNDIQSLEFEPTYDPDDPPYESAEHFAAEFTNITYFPSKVYIYDEKGNFVMKSQSVIYFHFGTLNKPYYCFLDEYLTPELKQQIKDAEAKYGNYSNFQFNLKDGKVIPVKLVYKEYEPYAKDTAEIVFTNEIPEYTVKLPSDYLQVTWNFIKTENADDDLEYEDNILSQIKTEDISNADEYDINSNIDEKTDGRYTYTANNYFSTREGKTYAYYSCLSVSIQKYALNSAEFKTNIKSLTAVFVILEAIAVAVTNDLLKKQEFKEAQYAFSGAAAHELKTPLAVIQNRCELLMENINPENKSDYIKSIYEESIRMNNLIGSLLQYNKLSSTSKINKKPVNLNETAEAEIKKYAPSASTKGIAFKKDFDKDCIIYGDEKFIALAIDNYLSNAVKFANENTQITVSIKKDGKHIKFSVFNYGKNINKSEQKNMWKMLYKGDESRKNVKDSGGIGLAVTAKILKLHKFKYGFKNKANGVEFYFVAKQQNG